MTKSLCLLLKFFFFWSRTILSNFGFILTYRMYLNWLQSIGYRCLCRYRFNDTTTPEKNWLYWVLQSLIGLGPFILFLFFNFKIKLIDFKKKLNSNSNLLTLKKLNLNSNSLTLQKWNSNSSSSITRERIQIQSNPSRWWSVFVNQNLIILSYKTKLENRNLLKTKSSF